MTDEKNETLRLLRALQGYCPDQGVRALLLGVSQSTVSRWDTDLGKGKVPRMDHPSVIRLRVAVESLEGKRPDFERGLRISIGEIETLLSRLQAMLPRAAAEVVEIGERGLGALDDAKAAGPRRKSRKGE